MFGSCVCVVVAVAVLPSTADRPPKTHTAAADENRQGQGYTAYYGDGFLKGEGMGSSWSREGGEDEGKGIRLGKGRDRETRAATIVTLKT